MAGRHVVADQRLQRDGGVGLSRPPPAPAGRRSRRPGGSGRASSARPLASGCSSADGETSTTAPGWSAAPEGRRPIGSPLRVTGPSPLGPADQVLAAVRRGVGQHHAEHRAAVAQQADRDRGAAPPAQEVAGPVVRVDHPGVPPRIARGQVARRRLLGDEAEVGEGLEQRGADRLLGLAVGRALVAAAARAAGPVELGRQQAGRLARRPDRHLQRAGVATPGP